MAFVANFALEICNAPGNASPINLAGAPSGRVPFNRSIASGSIVYYIMDDGTQQEWGQGTFTSGNPSQITRDAIFWTSVQGEAANAARLTFSGQTMVYTGVPSERLIVADNTGAVPLPAASTLPAHAIRRDEIPHGDPSGIVTTSDIPGNVAANLISKAQIPGNDPSKIVTLAAIPGNDPSQLTVLSNFAHSRPDLLVSAADIVGNNPSHIVTLESIPGNIAGNLIAALSGHVSLPAQSSAPGDAVRRDEFGSSVGIIRLPGGKRIEFGSASLDSSGHETIGYASGTGIVPAAAFAIPGSVTSNTGFSLFVYSMDGSNVVFGGTYSQTNAAAAGLGFYWAVIFNS